MLPQELYADVHQLHGIERRTALVGRARGVGREACELIFLLDAGYVCTGCDLVHIARMPGDRGVQLLPHMILGEEGLAGAPFFSGAAIVDDGAFLAGFFQVILHGKGCREGARSQHVVAAAVAGAALLKRVAHRNGCLLGKAGQGIEFAEYADDGVPMAVFAAERGLHAAHAGFHFEPVFGEQLFIHCRGLVFHQRKLGIFPYLVAGFGEKTRMAVDIIACCLFISVHSVFSLSGLDFRGVVSGSRCRGIRPGPAPRPSIPCTGRAR